MRTWLRLTLLASLLPVVAVNSAQAQRRGLVDITPRGDRHGAWIHLGIGAGDEAFRFANESSWDTSSPTKPAFSLRIGGTVNPYLRLGGELTGWADTYTDAASGERVTEYLGGLLVIGQVYPVRTLGLFVKGGAGLSRSGANVYGGVGTHEDGFAWSAGLGYEVRLARGIFLTPTIDYLQHRSESRDGPALYDRLTTIGVGFTFQPGRY